MTRAVLAALGGAGVLVCGPATAAAPDPGRQVVGGFLDAVTRGEPQAMTRLLSPQTRRRLSGGGLSRLQAEIAPIARSYRFVLSERINANFGVVAIAGPAGSFAMALRRSGTRWRLELQGPVAIEAVRPQPLERVRRRTQLAAEVKGPRSLTEAGLWFDGLAFDARGASSPDGRSMTMWGEAPQPLGRGSHIVVAFAAAGGDASALAWHFSVR